MTPDILNQASHGTGGVSPSVPTAPGLQASIQRELNVMLAAAQARFEAEVRAAMAESEAIMHSDIVSVRIAIGEEALFRRTDDGSIDALIQWMVSNGWAPVGVPTSPDKI